MKTSNCYTNILLIAIIILLCFFYYSLHEIGRYQFAINNNGVPIAIDTKTGVIKPYYDKEKITGRIIFGSRYDAIKFPESN